MNPSPQEISMAKKAIDSVQCDCGSTDCQGHAIGLEQAIAFLLATHRSEILRGVREALVNASYNPDGECRVCHKTDNTGTDGTKYCEGIQMLNSIDLYAAGLEVKV